MGHSADAGATQDRLTTDRGLRTALARTVVSGALTDPADPLRLAGGLVATLFSPDEIWALLRALDELGQYDAGIARTKTGWLVTDDRRTIEGPTIGQVMAAWRELRDAG